MQHEAVAVAAAAQHLDEIRPGWAALINTETLNLMDGDRCIFGQLQIEEDSEFNWSSFKSAEFHPFASYEAAPYWIDEVNLRCA